MSVKNRSMFLVTVKYIDVKKLHEKVFVELLGNLFLELQPKSLLVLKGLIYVVASLPLWVRFVKG